jgi:hypothetical protein
MTETFEQEKLFELIKDDLSVFVEEILGLENADFHNELDAILSNYNYRDIVIAISRGHGKSTHLSVAYPLWEIAKNHNIRILLISSTSGIATSFLTQILNHIELNDKYREWARWCDPEGNGVVPKKRQFVSKEEKWAKEAITIERDDLNLKDPTIHAVGLFGSILSKRADIIILDDVVNQKNSETEDQRQKIKDWIYTTVRPVLARGGRFICLGNTWHQDDLMANLLKDPQIHYRRRMPAIISESTNIDLWNEYANIYLREDIDIIEKKRVANLFYIENKEKMEEGVKVLWPEWHDPVYPSKYAELYLERIRNPYSFARMYQCDPSKRPDQKIKDEWIEHALERGKNLRLQDAPREGLVMKDTTGGLDLAISEKQKSDDNVFLTLDQVFIGNSEFQPGDYIIRNIDRGKFTPKSLKELVKIKYEMIGHSEIRVENVAYQDAMRRDLADESIPVKGHHTGGEKNDPVIGINSIAILLEQGKFVLPYDRTDSRTINLISQLVNEMRNWPEGHTGDSLMALWFAFLAMRDHRAKGITIPKPMSQVVQEKILQNREKELYKDLDLEIINKSLVERSGGSYKPHSPKSEKLGVVHKKYVF